MDHKYYHISSEYSQWIPVFADPYDGIPRAEGDNTSVDANGLNLLFNFLATFFLAKLVVKGFSAAYASWRERGQKNHS